MKKIGKNMLALVVAVIMLFGSVPLDVLSGIDMRWSFGFPPITAKAAEAEQYLFPLFDFDYYGITGKYSTAHFGIDIATTDKKNHPVDGRPIHASKSGTVVDQHTDTGGGIMMVIKHSENDFTYYGHMKSVCKKKNDSVVQGDTIGTVGKTGTLATGYHLHFQIMTSKMYYDKKGKYTVNCNIDKIPYIYELPITDISNIKSSNITPKSAQLSCVVSNPSKAKLDFIAYQVCTSKKFEIAPSALYIQYLKNSPFEGTWKSDISSTNTITVKSILPNTKYYYRFIIKTEKGDRIYSDTGNFTTSKSKPPKTKWNWLKSISKYMLIMKSSASAQSDAPTVDCPDISIGSSVLLNWEQTEFAEYYTVSVNGIERPEQITDTQQALTLDTAGVKELRIRAHNDAGSGEWSDPAVVTVHPDVNVSFFVDGALHQKLAVKWGGSIAQLPDVPVKKGSVFTGWYEDGNTVFAGLSEIKNDLNVYARYKKLTYTVTFKSPEGDVIGAPQTVEDGTAAIEPADRSFVPNDYHFVGWDKDFSNVKENLTVIAVTDWNDYTLPVELTNVSATRYQYGYTVYCTVNNRTMEGIAGRVIVALKTEAGKLITTTESAAYYVEDRTSEVIKVVTPNMDDDKAKNLTAVRAEVFAVQKFQTSVPVSPAVSVSITDMDPWTDWSLVRKTGSPYEEQIKIEYRYRDYRTATSSNSSMPGWTLTGSTYTLPPYGDTWSAYSTTQYYPSETREVGTRTVVDAPGYYEYKYHRYTDGAGHIHFCPKMGKDYYGGTWYVQESAWTTTDVAFSSISQRHGSVSGACPYCGMTTSQSAYGGTYGGKTYYHKQSRWIPEVSHTEWRYRDRSRIYTYHFDKWLDWSGWSTTPVTATAEKEVQTQTFYRYKENDLTRVEDNTGVLRTVPVSVGSEFAGKQATLMIYKISEAADWTIEYIAQAELDGTGSHTFADFKLREEPSIETGDYTVVLGIQGSNTQIFLDKIEAPLPQHEVNYLNYDDTVLSTQTVEEGGNATPPESPSREGYTFIGWDMRSTNIGQPTNISAQYKINEYVVVFVDWAHKTYDIQTYDHGAPIVYPQLDNTDSSLAAGWDKALQGVETVTSNMVVCASFETKTFTVDFYDYNMNVIDTQVVEYGGYAEAPMLEEGAGYVFYDWTCPEFEPSAFNIESQAVTQNLSVYPEFAFAETVEMPYASVETGEYDTAQTVELTCATEGAVIYYTLDGSDPAEALNPAAVEYTVPVTVSESAQLRAYACAFGKNDSYEASEYYAINSGGSIHHILTLTKDGPDRLSWIVPDGYVIDTAIIPATEGYDFEGLYRDEELTDRWVTETDTVTDSVTLFMNYSPKVYNVIFKDSDGAILDVQAVEYLAAAAEPEYSPPAGYVFTGWDTEDFYSVTGDLTVTAKVVPESEYARISLDRSQYTMMAGTTLTLSAEITPVELTGKAIYWYSTDETVATVDENGLVATVSVGSAVITAVVTENGEFATCDVTVTANPGNTICLVAGSMLCVDSSGYLRGIKVTSNTVAELKTKFANVGLVFVGMSGSLLSDTEIAGTGTVIRLMNGTEVLDEITAVITGDMTGDGLINNRDASMATRYLVGKESPVDCQITAVDVNADGIVNNRDAAMISRYLVGKEVI